MREWRVGRECPRQHTEHVIMMEMKILTFDKHVVVKRRGNSQPVNPSPGESTKITKRIYAIGIKSSHWRLHWSVFWWAGYQRRETALRVWWLLSHKFGTQKHGVSKRRFFSKYDKINIQVKTKVCISMGETCSTDIVSAASHSEHSKIGNAMSFKAPTIWHLFTLNTMVIPWKAPLSSS